MRKLRGLFILDSETFPMIYGPAECRDIGDRVNLVAAQQTRASIQGRAELLRDVDVIFSGWGAPLMDEKFLDQAPNLKAVFYAAGAVGSWMTESVWERGIRVASAYAANAIPVAEYTLATILFSLKHGWALSRRTRDLRQFVPRDGAPGCYGSVVGLISTGAIARQLLSLLRHFDLHVVAYDPFLTDDEALRLGVERVSLAELFAVSDVVSLHAPEMPETEGLITGGLLASMKAGATFINTARGSIVRESELCEVLQSRPDLQAVLDVTQEEPPRNGSPLYTLPNVVLTPHIAGSVGTECRRMGRYMVEELDRYLAGEALKWEITPELAARSSHRPIYGKRQGGVQQKVAV